MAQSSADMSVAVPHNFEQINTLVLVSCAAFPSCHSTEAKGSANNLNLCSAPDRSGQSKPICDDVGTLESAWAALYNRPAVNKMAKNEGLLLVMPCDPANSFLVKKLELPETQVDGKVGYGSHMPSHGSQLPVEQRQAIRDWISRGAHLDEPATITGSTCVITSPDTGTGDAGN